MPDFGSALSAGMLKKVTVHRTREFHPSVIDRIHIETATPLEITFGPGRMIGVDDEFPHLGDPSRWSDGPDGGSTQRPDWLHVGPFDVLMRDSGAIDPVSTTIALPGAPRRPIPISLAVNGENAFVDIRGEAGSPVVITALAIVGGGRVSGSHVQIAGEARFQISGRPANPRTHWALNLSDVEGADGASLDIDGRDSPLHLAFSQPLPVTWNARNPGGTRSQILGTPYLWRQDSGRELFVPAQHPSSIELEMVEGLGC